MIVIAQPYTNFQEPLSESFLELAESVPGASQRAGPICQTKVRKQPARREGLRSRAFLLDRRQPLAALRGCYGSLRSSRSRRYTGRLMSL